MHRELAASTPFVAADATMTDAHTVMHRAGASWAAVVHQGVVVGIVTAQQTYTADSDAMVIGSLDSDHAELVWFDRPASRASGLAA